MSDPVPARRNDSDDATPFDDLFATPTSASTPAARATEATFATVFRGYDKDEVDATIANLNARVRAGADTVAQLRDREWRAGAETQSAVERLEAELAAAQEREASAVEGADAAVDAATADARDRLERLEAELATANAKSNAAEQRAQALTEELTGAAAETPNRHQFEEVLRVAEEQAGVLLRNASVQGERLLEAAREEILNRRKDAEAEAEAIVSQAQHEAQQSRLRIDTERTAHDAGIEREAAHAAEKVAQAAQEAAAIRSEAEKGAAALRSLVARETANARSEAEEAVRELRVRALEFEASLTRRQDDAQQEFLVLHNQAVAHAERITQDANEQVAASLDHAQRVSAKADDFERLMRAQAQQIEADANLRAHAQLDQARGKAQKIIDLVTSHAQSALRDAEDRTRQLRWQEHQLTSFMAEVKELIRPDSSLSTPRTRQAEQPAVTEDEPFLEAGTADASAEVDSAPTDAADAPIEADDDIDIDSDADSEDALERADA